YVLAALLSAYSAGPGGESLPPPLHEGAAADGQRPRCRLPHAMPIFRTSGGGALCDLWLCYNDD
ncbi:unnamed protein product, partial [Symbiodinium sp. CCMP2456]